MNLVLNRSKELQLLAFYQLKYAEKKKLNYEILLHNFYTKNKIKSRTELSLEDINKYKEIYKT
jgi:hypothetical protein